MFEIADKILLKIISRRHVDIGSDNRLAPAKLSERSDSYKPRSSDIGIDSDRNMGKSEKYHYHSIG